MLVLLTTANYPDVMLPSYSQNRWCCWFFIVYIVLGVFYLMNLLLAIFYNNYRTRVEKRLEKQGETRNSLIWTAFGMLDAGNTGKVPQ